MRCDGLAPCRPKTAGNPRYCPGASRLGTWHGIGKASDVHRSWKHSEMRFLLPSLRPIALAGLLGLIALADLSSPTLAASRVKDIADFEGIRENMLVGYG